MRPIVNGLRPAFPTAFLFLVCAHLFGSTVAQAAPCIADPGPGVIKDKWLAMGGHGVLGCPLTTERDVPGNDGRYVQFQNGQVVFSPRQRMVVAAWEDAGANGLSSTAKVDWTVLDTFSYDFFLIRWRVEGDDEDKQHETDAGGTGGFHEFTDDDERGAGHFRIVVEGCEDGGFLRFEPLPPGLVEPGPLGSGLHRCLARLVLRPGCRQVEAREGPSDPRDSRRRDCVGVAATGAGDSARVSADSGRRTGRGQHDGRARTAGRGA